MTLAGLEHGCKRNGSGHTEHRWEGYGAKITSNNCVLLNTSTKLTILQDHSLNIS